MVGISWKLSLFPGARRGSGSFCEKAPRRLTDQPTERCDTGLGFGRVVAVLVVILLIEPARLAAQETPNVPQRTSAPQCSPRLRAIENGHHVQPRQQDVECEHATRNAANKKDGAIDPIDEILKEVLDQSALKNQIDTR